MVNEGRFFNCTNNKYEYYMEPGITLFTFNAPEDKLNGADLRIWTLLGEGQATRVCFEKKKLNENGSWHRWVASLIPVFKIIFRERFEDEFKGDNLLMICKKSAR